MRSTTSSAVCVVTLVLSTGCAAFGGDDADSGPGFDKGSPPVPVGTSAEREVINVHGDTTKMTYTVKKIVYPARMTRTDKRSQPGYRAVAVKLSLTDSGSRQSEEDPVTRLAPVNSRGKDEPIRTGTSVPQYRPQYPENSFSLQSGDHREGYVLLLVPATSKITAVRYDPAGTDPRGDPQWRLP